MYPLVEYFAVLPRYAVGPQSAGGGQLSTSIARRGLLRNLANRAHPTYRMPKHKTIPRVPNVFPFSSSRGSYGDPGIRTCMGYPGQFEHEYQDAQTLADWGVDFW